MKRMRAEYAFADDWWLPGCRAADVRDVLVDLEFYPSWWPEIRAVAKLGEDRAWARCRSRLPYTLDLVLTAVSRDLPTLKVDVDGDLRGSVRWTLCDDDDAEAGTHVRLRQDVDVDGWLAALTKVARPVLEWNHAQMLASGRVALRERTLALSGLEVGDE